MYQFDYNINLYVFKCKINIDLLFIVIKFRLIYGYFYYINISYIVGLQIWISRFVQGLGEFFSGVDEIVVFSILIFVFVFFIDCLFD